MMINAVPLACFLSMIRPPGVQFDNALLQIAPVDKTKCPLVRDTNDVTFRLYTRYNPIEYQELIIGDDEKLFASNINFKDRTVIFFHAFMEMPDDGSGLQVREAYMMRGDVNFIFVDASQLEAGPWYFTAADNTWYIGRFGAKFIDYLVSRGLDLSRTHLIGHSLGAQAAGVAGGFLTSGRVSRITGLDPALPLFAKLPLEQRLDPSDADFVDIIHTDAGIFGVNYQAGHADFFPNGGISPQPGCELEVVLHQQQFFNKFFCSHWRSYMFYAESVLRPDGFIASPCESWKAYRSGACAYSRKKRSHLPHMGFGAEPTSMKPHGYYTFDLLPVKTELSGLGNIDKNKTHTEPEKAHRNNMNKDVVRKIDKQNRDREDKNDLKKDTTYNKVKYNVPKVRNVDISSDDDLDTTSFEESSDMSFDLEAEEADLEATLTRIKLTEKETTKHKKYQDLKRETLIDSFSKDSDLNLRETDSTQLESHVKKRQKRFINIFQKSEATENENFLFRMLEFLNNNRRHTLPVFTVMREINTLVKSANGELNHSTKERNNYIGHNPPLLPLASYSLELGSDSKVKAFVKRLLGLKVEGDRLTITGK